MARSTARPLKEAQTAATERSSLSRHPARKPCSSFGSSGDGVVPYAGLLNVKGTLYGTTLHGGRSGGDGTVFSITPPGTETVRYSFGLYHNGAQPYAGLLNVMGTLYGTTFYGGARLYGIVFSMTPSGTERVLYSFKGGSGDGERPSAGLVNVRGTLYGTTLYGGANLDGTVFSITSSGTETVLHSFGTSEDGKYPYAGLLKVKGTLYGTTRGGGANASGTVFSITPSGTETVLYSFKGGSGDGQQPDAGLINVKGTLYGTTLYGGANDDGTVFSITPSGTETLLYSFKGGSGDGAVPYAGLVSVNGTLYGTTSKGGASSYGTVFSLTP